MSQLTGERCVACRRDSLPVTDEEMAQLRPAIPDWELVNEGGIQKLDRVFRFGDFQQALDFTMAVGDLA